MAEQTSKPKCTSYASVVFTKIGGEIESLNTGFSQLQQETIANNANVTFIGYLSNTPEWDKEAGRFGEKILHRKDMYGKYNYELLISHPMKAMRQNGINSSVRIKVITNFPLRDIFTSATEIKYVVVTLENGIYTKGDNIGKHLPSLTNKPYTKSNQLVGDLVCYPKQVLELVKTEKESRDEAVPLEQDPTQPAVQNLGVAQEEDLL